jgi:ubiquinone/menaquinone biosynthesis C-methylase UbiE
MQRVDAAEILDSDACSAADVRNSMRDLGRVNRWFGGVSTTRKMVEGVAQATGAKQISLLEVAAGSGELPELIRQKLDRRGIRLDVTLLDRSQAHLPHSKPESKSRTGRSRSLVGDALALPFHDAAFDVVSCNLFAHHLNPEQLAQFTREGLRVSRHALLLNDLVRHPVHLALAFAARPLMRSRIAWLDGLTSVRRAYVPEEIRNMLPLTGSLGTRIEISRHYLFRMGVIVWRG